MQNKVLPILTLLLLFFLNGFAQKTSYIKDRWNYKLGFTSVPDGNYRGWRLDTRGEFNYGVLPYLEVGAYAGFRNVIVIVDHITRDSGQLNIKSLGENSQIFSYGININLQLLSFFISKPDFSLDCYVSGKLGGESLLLNPRKGLHGDETYSYMSTTERTFRGDNGFTFSNSPPKKFSLQYSLGLGIGFHFLKICGFFVEYNYGKCNSIFIPIKSEWRYGITLQF